MPGSLKILHRSYIQQVTHTQSKNINSTILCSTHTIIMKGILAHTFQLLFPSTIACSYTHTHTNAQISDFGMSRGLEEETYYMSKGGKIPI